MENFNHLLSTLANNQLAIVSSFNILKNATSGCFKNVLTKLDPSGIGTLTIDDINATTISADIVNNQYGELKQDIFSFEVLANKNELPISTLFASLGVSGETLHNLVAIPAGLTQEIKIYSNTDPDICDIRVDWGDETIETAADSEITTYNDEEYINYKYTFRHTYTIKEDQKRFIVKIVGKNYWRINFPSDGSSLVSRILENDLDFPEHLVNISSIAQNSPRLLKVIRPRWTGKNVLNMFQAFANCKNLQVVKGLYSSQVGSDCNVGGLFSGCDNLIYTDLCLPAAIASDSRGTATGIESTFFGCHSLGSRTVYINGENVQTTYTSLLPKQGFINNKISFRQVFNACWTLSGTLDNSILWNDLTKIWQNTSNAFSYIRNEEIKAQVPVSWGGTNTTIKLNNRNGNTLNYNNISGYINLNGEISASHYFTDDGREIKPGVDGNFLSATNPSGNGEFTFDGIISAQHIYSTATSTYLDTDLEILKAASGAVSALISDDESTKLDVDLNYTVNKVIPAPVKQFPQEYVFKITNIEEDDLGKKDQVLFNAFKAQCLNAEFIYDSQWSSENYYQFTQKNDYQYLKFNAIENPNPTIEFEIFIQDYGPIWLTESKHNITLSEVQQQDIINFVSYVYFDTNDGLFYFKINFEKVGAAPQIININDKLLLSQDIASTYVKLSGDILPIKKIQAGYMTSANAQYSHAEGYKTITSGMYSHAEGQGTIVTGLYAHSEGYSTNAFGNYSHTEGNRTSAILNGAHAEGQNTLASGAYTHTEGTNTLAVSQHSHAEGDSTSALSIGSHTEGFQTIVSGNYGHAEGYNTIAGGNNSHAEGYKTIASGMYSHAEGQNTIAQGNYQHVEGKWNSPSNSYQHIVGCGTSDIDRKNSQILDWSGNQWNRGSISATHFYSTFTNYMIGETRQYIGEPTAGIYNANYQLGDFHKVSVTENISIVPSNILDGDGLIVYCNNPSAMIIKYNNKNIIKEQGEFLVSFIKINNNIKYCGVTKL